MHSSSFAPGCLPADLDTLRDCSCVQANVLPPGDVICFPSAPDGQRVTVRDPVQDSLVYSPSQHFSFRTCHGHPHGTSVRGKGHPSVSCHFHVRSGKRSASAEESGQPTTYTPNASKAQSQQFTLVRKPRQTFGPGKQGEPKPASRA